MTRNNLVGWRGYRPRRPLLQREDTRLTVEELFDKLDEGTKLSTTPKRIPVPNHIQYSQSDIWATAYLSGYQDALNQTRLLIKGILKQYNSELRLERDE